MRKNIFVDFNSFVLPKERDDIADAIIEYTELSIDDLPILKNLEEEFTSINVLENYSKLVDILMSRKKARYDHRYIYNKINAMFGNIPLDIDLDLYDVYDKIKNRFKVVPNLLYCSPWIELHVLLEQIPLNWGNYYALTSSKVDNSLLEVFQTFTNGSCIVFGKNKSLIDPLKNHGVKYHLV